MRPHCGIVSPETAPGSQVMACVRVVASRKRSYCVEVCEGLSNNGVRGLIDAIGSRRCLFVTTPTVARLYANGIVKRLLDSGADLSVIVVECSEQSKVLSEVEKLCQQCFRARLD